MNQEYLAQMRAHVDEGGKLTHANAVDLLCEIERLNARTSALRDALKPFTQWRPWKGFYIEQNGKGFSAKDIYKARRVLAGAKVV